MTAPTPGSRFRAAVASERPLQIAGTINAYCALLAERAGFKAIYLSGAGVANASFALPDLGITTLNDVLEDARRITRATAPPNLRNERQRCRSHNGAGLVGSLSNLTSQVRALLADLIIPDPDKSDKHRR